MKVKGPPLHPLAANAPRWRATTLQRWREELEGLVVLRRRTDSRRRSIRLLIETKKKVPYFFVISASRVQITQGTVRRAFAHNVPSSASINMMTNSRHNYQLPSIKEDPFAVSICEILFNVNAAIAQNVSSIKRLEEEHSKNTEVMNEKFDALLQHTKSLEDRLKGIEDQTQANADAIGVFERCQRDLVLRVSSIESLIIRSRK